MAVFSYTALDSLRVVSRGTVAADTPRQARDFLRDRGLSVQMLGKAKKESRFDRRTVRGSRRTRGQVVGLIRELSTLLGVGVPLLEALDTILRQRKGPFRTSLLQVRDRVASGVSLADALREQPSVFDAMSVNLVEVGESSGTLDVVLQQLARFKERSAGLKNRLMTALIYPAIVLVMALGTSITLMTVVVPQLLTALTDAGKPLPLPTRIVKSASDFLVDRGWVLGIVVAGVIAAVALILRTPAGRMRWHRAQLKLPIIGPMAQKQSLVQVAIVMSTLLRSGIVFVRAVRVAADAAGNLVIREALVRCESAVTGGRDIGQAMEAAGAFPPVVVQVFSVGQHSGRLEDMLDQLATDYDAEVQLASQRLTALLEPLLIVLLVGVVGLIGFATVMPLMEAADAF